MRRTRSPRRFRKARPRSSTQAVVDETVALFHWLSWVSDQLYGEGGSSAPQRWVLRRIYHDGPRTVPDLARARAIRRQSLQPVVDALAREALVELRDNPHHARSKLVALTRRGRELADEMDRIDDRVLRAVSRGIPDDALTETAETLRRLRQAFETGPRWKPLAAQRPVGPGSAKMK